MVNGRVDLNSDEVLDLVRSARLGDRQAMTQLVVLLSPIVRAHAKRVFVSDEAEREDLFQEGMFGVIEAIRKYDASRGASFLTYVNLCVRWKLLEATGGSPDEGSLLPDSEVENVGSDLKPYAYVELTDFISKRLTALEFDTLRLFISGYKYQQIADKLGTTVKSVDGTLQRVRKKLREYFD